MEARAGLLINTMLDAINATQHAETSHLIVGLSRLREGLVEITGLLQRMDERCNPEVFYHRVRPLLAGSLNMEWAGLSKGVFYDEGHGTCTARCTESRSDDSEWSHRGA